MAPPRRAYTDTSIFGGAEDDEFRDATFRFLGPVRRGRYVLVISELTLRELAEAPPKVRRALSNLPPDSAIRVPPEVEGEAGTLADAYIAAGVLGEARRDDASHVAIATVARAGLILSWNFRHIVNYSRIHRFNRVNETKGYPPIEIHSPFGVVYGDEGEDESQEV